MNSVYEFFLMTWPVWAFAAIVGAIVIAAERIERKKNIKERHDLREAAENEAEKEYEKLAKELTRETYERYEKDHEKGEDHYKSGLH